MINEVSLLNHSLEKMLCAILLAIWSNKPNIVGNVLKRHFNRETVMAKEGNEDFENST